MSDTPNSFTITLTDNPDGTTQANMKYSPEPNAESNAHAIGYAITEFLKQQTEHQPLDPEADNGTAQ